MSLQLFGPLGTLIPLRFFGCQLFGPQNVFGPHTIVAAVPFYFSCFLEYINFPIFFFFFFSASIFIFSFNGFMDANYEARNKTLRTRDQSCKLYSLDLPEGKNVKLSPRTDKGTPPLKTEQNKTHIPKKM